MPAYPSAQAKYDISDPASYPGSGSTIFDISVNSFDISLNNATYNSGSGVVPSIEFNGNSNSFGYLNGAIANIVTASPTVFSFNIWVKAFYDTSAPGYEACWSYGTDAGGIPSLWLDRNGNDPTYDGGSSNPIISSGFTAPNDWTLYSIVSNASTITFYINGVSYGSASTTSRGVGSPPKFLIGGFDTADFLTVSYPCDFEFNRLEIHNTALSAGQVLQYFNDTKIRYLVPTPIVDLDFSDPACFNGTGTTVNDLSGFNNDFALADTDYEFTTTFGGELFIDTINLDTLLNRSGLTGYTYGSAAFSFNMWVQINAYNALDLTQIWSLNFTGGSGSPHNNPFCGALGASKYFFFTDGTDTLNTTFVMEPDTWYLVTITYPSGGTTNDIVIYINGVSIAYTGGTAGVLNVASGNPLNSLSGSLANSAVWNSAQTIGSYNFYNVELSAADVLAYYTDTQARFLNLYIKYDFQDPACYSGSGSVINDLAGSNTQLSVYSGNWVSGTTNYWDLQGNTILENTNPPSELLSNSFTINCWYYPDFTNPGFYASVWGLGLNNPNQMPILSTQQTGSFNIQWSYGYNAVSYTPTIDWHLVSFVSTGTDTILYVDGALIGTVASAGTIGNIAGVTRLRLGCSNTSGGSAQEPAYGRIGYWDYHTVPLSAGEILDLYNATNAPYVNPPPPPYAGSIGGRSFAQGFNG